MVRKKRHWLRYLFILILVAIIGAGAVLAYNFYRMSVQRLEPLKAESDSINLLLLGYGGSGHDGVFLTDSIMLVSIQKSSGKIAMISIPRDLYVAIPGENYKQKINFAYSLGMGKSGADKALAMSKEAVAQITGLNIDYAVSVDHAAFKEVIDILGGVDIYLDQPFSEDQQWAGGGDYGYPKAFHIQNYTITTDTGTQPAQKWVFSLPAGTTHLDGTTALYFVRARYSSTDFDRMQRQQQVLSAIKNKAASAGILTNPVKLIKLINSSGNNIKMDMAIGDITNLFSYYSKADVKNIIHQVFDTTDGGLLYESKSDKGEYILLPVGDNFDKIREACKNIFQ